LAHKYIGILKHTVFYRDWAEQVELLMDHPELIAHDAEREPITHMLHYSDVLGGDQGYTERFLMTQLARSNDISDPLFQEQALLATLWTKDLKQFWFHFSNYINLHPNDPMPRYFQEAAYLYGMIEERQDLEKMPFDVQVKETFDRFASTMSNYDGMDTKIAREELYPFFGDTYFYDYYTMTNLPEY
jgi:hypothetical protein